MDYNWTETYRKFLELNPAQIAIIVSGYADIVRAEEILELGAGSCLRKPITLKIIGAAVRNEFDKKLIILQI
jgi:ActR/RegA family two-component response regulator